MGRFREREVLNNKTELMEYSPTILYLCPSKRQPMPPCEYTYIYIALKSYYSYHRGF